MIALLASCTGTTATGPASSAQVACDIARLASSDPALAARIVSGFGPHVPALHAEFATEVTRLLGDGELRALARTAAGRDLLDTLESAVTADGPDPTRRGQIDRLHGARLAVAATPSERATELIRQAGVPHPADGDLLGRNLVAEIRRDINAGSALVYAILARPNQRDRALLALDMVDKLTDQELLTLAKTPLGRQAVEQLDKALEMPHGLRTHEGRRVAQALDPKLDSYAHHVAQVQSDLYGKGLPISAKGVQVFVLEEPGRHADAVKRTISGENGLGQDADVVVRDALRTAVRTLDKDATLAQRAAYGLANLDANLDATRAGIKAVREGVPADGKTRLVNISWGGDIASMAQLLAKQVRKASPDWTLAAGAVLDKTGREPKDEQVRQELADRIAVEMVKQSEQPVNLERSTKLHADLQMEVDAATRKGLLIFKSGGNGGYTAAELSGDDLARPITAGIRGIVTVGAANLHDTSTPRDDAMWVESAPGADIAAPGVDVAAGTGTSFAAPYAASVAALMIAANPKITPQQIRDILLSGRVTRDLPGPDDGKGLLDPVKAVAEAKKLAGR